MTLKCYGETFTITAGATRGMEGPTDNNGKV
jgi:hypothetical protein